MSGVYGILADWTERHPEKVALIAEHEGTRTYAELLAGAQRAGFVYEHELGLDVGERVCLWTTNRLDWFDAYIGASSVGVATVQANPEWSDEEIGFVLDHARCRAVVCEPELAARAADLVSRLTHLDHVLVAGVEESESGRAWSSLLAAAPDDCADQLRTPPPSFLAGLAYTSGTTTGRPKAVRARSEHQGRQVDYHAMFGLDERDRIMFVTPVFHGNAMGAWMAAIAYGASAVFQRRFSARSFWRVVDTYRPTVLFTLAPIVNILMARPPSPGEQSHSFRVMIVLGSGASAAAIEERFGAPVIDWYGMTEAGTGTYTPLGEVRRPGSAGKRFPGSSMQVLREDLSVADPGEAGEVGFRLEDIHFDGYADDDEATTAAIRDGWFLTGDIGYFDADGYFYFVDRRKDVVRRGGENVSSVEVETVLREHPGVADVAIVAKPDPVLGERIVAFVVPSRDADTPVSADDFRAFARDRLAAFKLPDEVFRVDALPRTATGKIEKFRLRRGLTGDPSS